jgi:hypothetical protein
MVVPLLTEKAMFILKIGAHHYVLQNIFIYILN